MVGESDRTRSFNPSFPSIDTLHNVVVVRAVLMIDYHTMNPTPAKRARKSSSPPSPAASLPRPGSSRPLRPPGSAGGPPSPLQPFLPRPPSGHTSHPSLPSFPHLTSGIPSGPGPSTWSSAWPGGSNPNPNMSRRSVDPTSPSDLGSPQMDMEETTSTETGLVFTRDTSGRAPRSMMACTRCRRQKCVLPRGSIPLR